MGLQGERCDAGLLPPNLSCSSGLLPHVRTFAPGNQCWQHVASQVPAKRNSFASDQHPYIIEDGYARGEPCVSWCVCPSSGATWGLCCNPTTERSSTHGMCTISEFSFNRVSFTLL